jgi:hypothetical protein
MGQMTLILTRPNFLMVCLVRILLNIRTGFLFENPQPATKLNKTLQLFEYNVNEV